MPREPWDGLHPLPRPQGPRRRQEHPTLAGSGVEEHLGERDTEERVRHLSRDSWEWLRLFDDVSVYGIRGASLPSTQNGGGCAERGGEERSGGVS